MQKPNPLPHPTTYTQVEDINQDLPRVWQMLFKKVIKKRAERDKKSPLQKVEGKPTITP